MKKLFFSILGVSFLLLNSLVVKADITLSPNTSSATWYRIKSVRAVGNGHPPYLKASTENDITLDYATTGDDAFLWCFVGTDMDVSVRIYNKLHPTKEVVVSGGAIALSSIETTSNFRIGTDGEFYGFGRLDNPGVNLTYIHVSNGGGLTFYSFDAGSRWIIEDESLPIAIDKTVVEGLITAAEIRLVTDKDIPNFETDYADAITVLEDLLSDTKTALAASGITQAAVNALVNPLKKATDMYKFTTFELPFVASASAGEGATWYYLINKRNLGTGDDAYLTYGGALSQASKDNPSKDAQLWCFVGNNVDGFAMYSKAEYASGSLNYSFSMSAGLDKWFITNRTGATNFAIFNPTTYKYDYNEFNGIHGNEKTSGVVMYNDNDGGSFWNFELVGVISNIKEAGDNSISVYSENGAICIKGYEGEAMVVSMNGSSVKIDAQTPYAINIPGVYVVVIEGQAFKVNM